MSTLLRPARDDDFGFILDSWRDSFARYSDLCKRDRQLYSAAIMHVVRRILKDPDSVAIVACDPQDEDTIVGYAVAKGTTLHYVYVRADFRKHRIARDLIERIGQPKTYSFRTEHGTRRFRPDILGWSYQPFQLEIA